MKKWVAAGVAVIAVGAISVALLPHPTATAKRSAVKVAAASGTEVPFPGQGAKAVATSVPYKAPAASPTNQPASGSTTTTAPEPTANASQPVAQPAPVTIVKSAQVGDDCVGGNDVATYRTYYSDGTTADKVITTTNACVLINN